MNILLPIVNPSTQAPEGSHLRLTKTEEGEVLVATPDASAVVPFEEALALMRNNPPPGVAYQCGNITATVEQNRTLSVLIEGSKVVRVRNDHVKAALEAFAEHEQFLEPTRNDILQETLAEGMEVFKAQFGVKADKKKPN